MVEKGMDENMKRKRSLLCRLFCLLLTLLMPAAALPVSAASSTRSISFFIGFYDDIDRSYIVENQTISSGTSLTIAQTLSLLEEEELLQSHELNDDGSLLRLTWTERRETFTLESNSSAVFYVRRNGQLLSTDQLDNRVSDGDVIEWVYASRSAYNSLRSTSSDMSGGGEVKPSAELWSSETSAALNAACEWLEIHRADSSFYLVAIGGAGKNINLNVVNDLLADVQRNREYDSPTEIARRILMLSFCGYDASNTDLSELLSLLMSYENIMQQGIFGAVNTLTAYDCRNYSVPSAVTNSRTVLVNEILAMQKTDGGFPVYTSSRSDVDTTAMVITALSGYTGQPEVADAIDKAVAYLVENQTETGGFGYQGQENCESLAQVIIALSSIGVKLDDERFVKKEKNLVSQLLAYQNEDGGFAHLLQAESNAMASEQAIVALTAVRKGKSPYEVSTSLKNVVAISEQAPVQELKSDTRIYIYIVAGLLALFIVSVLVIIFLRHSRRTNKR